MSIIDRSRFVVRISSARMPSSCWGRYEHVAVMEVDWSVKSVHAIDDRPSYVRRIVRYWGRQYVGKTKRSAASIAYEQAKSLAERLNKKETNRYLTAVQAEIDNALASRSGEDL